jgi:hypothetical protein
VKQVLFVLAAISMFVVGAAQAATTDTEELTEFLVKKGILTVEDAASFRADLAIMRQADAQKPKKEFNVVAKTPVNVSGYLQLQYNSTQGYNVYDEGKIRRARVSLSGDLTRQVGYKFQVDAVQPLRDVVQSATLTGSQSSGYTLTTKTTKVVTRPILLDAQIEYRPMLLPYVKFSVGQFKLPFGRENLESSPKLESIERSTMTERLVPGRDIGSQGRDIGGMAGGQVRFLEGKVAVDWASGVFNGAGINVGEDNYWKDTCERLIVTLWNKLSLGGSQYDGKFWAKRGSRNVKTDKIRSGAEATLVWEPISIKSEFVAVNDTLKAEGWYAQGLWHALKKPLDLEAVVKYEAYHPNLAYDADHVRTDVSTVGLNWNLNKSARLQANYQFRKDPEGQEKRNDTFLAQFQAQF